MNPNPNGISPETLASILLSRGVGNYTSIIDAINNISGGGGGSSEVSLNTAGLAQLESKLDEQSTIINEHTIDENDRIKDEINDNTGKQVEPLL